MCDGLSRDMLWVTRLQTKQSMCDGLSRDVLLVRRLQTKQYMCDGLSHDVLWVRRLDTKQSMCDGLSRDVLWVRRLANKLRRGVTPFKALPTRILCLRARSADVSSRRVFCDNARQQGREANARTNIQYCNEDRDFRNELPQSATGTQISVKITSDVRLSLSMPNDNALQAMRRVVTEHNREHYRR